QPWRRTDQAQVLRHRSLRQVLVCHRDNPLHRPDDWSRNAAQRRPRSLLHTRCSVCLELVAKRCFPQSAPAVVGASLEVGNTAAHGLILLSWLGWAASSAPEHPAVVAGLPASAPPLASLGSPPRSMPSSRRTTPQRTT